MGSFSLVIFFPSFFFLLYWFFLEEVSQRSYSTLQDYSIESILFQACQLGLNQVYQLEKKKPPFS